MLRIIAFPHRDGRSPIPVTANRPVACTLQPCAKLSVFHVFGHPRDLLVKFHHPVADLRHPHKPTRHRSIDERVATAPAVRVGVFKTRLSDETSFLPYELREWLVRLKPELSRDIRDLWQKPPPLIKRDNDRDACGVADLLILLTVGRGLVHDARAVLGRHVVSGEDTPGVFEPLVIAVVVENWFVPDTGEFGATQCSGHRGGRSSR